MTTQDDLARLERAVEEAEHTHGKLSKEKWAARACLLAARNDLAKESGLPYLEPVSLGFTLEPNAPDPLLIRGSRDVLLVKPHFDDEDQRRVGIVWTRCILASLTPPNDEGRAGSRLGELGLGSYGAGTRPSSNAVHCWRRSTISWPLAQV